MAEPPENELQRRQRLEREAQTKPDAARQAQGAGADQQGAQRDPPPAPVLRPRGMGGPGSTPGYADNSTIQQKRSAEAGGQPAETAFDPNARRSAARQTSLGQTASPEQTQPRDVPRSFSHDAKRGQASNRFNANAHRSQAKVQTYEAAKQATPDRENER